MNIGLARNQSCRFLMFGAAMLKALEGEARTQSRQTHLRRIPTGDSWVYLLSQIRGKSVCRYEQVHSRERVALERIEWKKDRT